MDSVICSALISTLVSTIVSIYVSNRALKETKRNSYFKEIAKLYYSIDEVHQLMKNETDKGIESNVHYYGNRIKVYSTMLLNYIKKYPKPKGDTQELENILLAIIVNPNWDRDYMILMNEFQNFCWTIDLEQKKSYQFTTS